MTFIRHGSGLLFFAGKGQNYLVKEGPIPYDPPTFVTPPPQLREIEGLNIKSGGFPKTPEPS